MPELTYYAQGDWNSTCDVCGRGFKFSQLRKRWDNAQACSACWETRQPQDFVRAVKDDQSVPIARPRIGLPDLPAIWINNFSTPLPWVDVPGAEHLWLRS